MSIFFNLFIAEEHFENSDSYKQIYYNLQQLTFRKLREMQTPFIKKVKSIMEDSKNRQIICWSDDKTMIEIRNQKFFQEKILSRHFRHNRISSFIRQLNLYGFKKIRTAQYRVFTHPLLQKGLGLQAILNKKKKSLKNSEENDVNFSINIDPTHSRIGIPHNFNYGQEKKNQHGISQNLMQKKETERHDITVVSTDQALPSSDQGYSMIWFMPVQQPTYKMPYPVNQGIFLNFNINQYGNWC